MCNILHAGSHAEAPIRTSLLRDTVHDRLRDAIVDGTLAPGEVVRDTELAAWLGVSRTPVREALLRLGETGLVRAAPGRSTVVAEIDLARGPRDAHAVVAPMHRLAVAEAVARLTADDLDRMREANARFAAAIEERDTDGRARPPTTSFHGVAGRRVGQPGARHGPRPVQPGRTPPRAAPLRLPRRRRVGRRCTTGWSTACGPATSRPRRTVAFRTWQNLADLIPDARHPTPTDPDQQETPMILDQFPRHPLTFGPSPVHHLAAADRPPRRAGRRRAGLGQARGRQQRAGLRRQQDPQAGVHRPRRARQRRRHARLDRRLPVQPHPPGRRGRRAPRAEVPTRAGEVGAVGRPDQHPGRQHPAAAG